MWLHQSLYCFLEITAVLVPRLMSGEKYFQQRPWWLFWEVLAVTENFKFKADRHKLLDLHMGCCFPYTQYGACMHACEVASVMYDFLWSHALLPTRLLCPWDFPGVNTGVICHALFPSRPKDQTCVSYVSCIDEWVLYHWSHLESPHNMVVL